MRWSGGHVPALAVAWLIRLLGAAPLASLLVIAAGNHDIWLHLARYVLPTALVQTALLLAGVAALAVLIGVGTAWTVATLEFPGRRLVAAVLPLPLAVPTYIAAYIYVDLLDALGPVQSTLRALTGWRSPADYWFPQVRSLGGAVFVFGLVLYPYVY